MDKTKQTYLDLRASIDQLMRGEEYEKALKKIEKALQHYSEDRNLIFQKAEALFLTGDLKKSSDITFNLLKESPNDIQLLKLCANQQYLFNNLGVSIKIYEKILKMSPKDFDSYINITNTLIHLNKIEEAIHYSKKGLKIKNDSSELYNNLIVSLILNKEFLEAFAKVKAVEDLNPLSKIPPSYGVYLNEQLKKNYQFKYLTEPYDYIREYNFNNENNDFMKNFYNFILDLPMQWEPKYKTTTNGSQTDNDLFYTYKDNSEVKILINFIMKCVDEYREFYKKTEDLYIKEFPNQYSLSAWAVNLKSSGYQASHNHISSWMSGVFYLKIPKNLNKDEGSIKFSKHGYNFPKNDNTHSSKIIEAREGGLVMFPSSLFHETIPFKSDEDRISIAFDIQSI